MENEAPKIKIFGLKKGHVVNNLGNKNLKEAGRPGI